MRIPLTMVIGIRIRVFFYEGKRMNNKERVI